jgi:hypothetical protein
MSASDSRRNALAVSIGWWYLRRLIRKRGTAAVSGLLAGEGLSFHEPRKRHRLRWLLIGGGLLAAAGGVFWWRRQSGGDDDWGDWEPVAPDSPFPSEPVPTPEPAPEPVVT